MKQVWILILAISKILATTVNEDTTVGIVWGYNNNIEFDNNLLTVAE